MACAAQPDPGLTAAPIHPDAAQGAELYAVVTASEIDALVGIDVESHSITRVAVLGPNPLQPHMDGGMVSVPPRSVVLSDSTASQTLLWRWAAGAGTIVQALDRRSGELVAVDAPGAGVLPFLSDGRLGWASVPRDGKPRLIGVDGTVEVELPGEPRFVVAGPGARRVTAVVDRGNPNNDHRDYRIVTVDFGEKTVTEIPTGRFHFGGIWADDTTLVASVFARVEPTADDPENGEPDTRVLTWSIDGGDTDPEAVAGLIAGPTLTTARFYPARLTTGEGLVAVESGVFDTPSVETLALGAGGREQSFFLIQSEFITAMSIVDTTLVVLQSRHVTFIDLGSGKATVVDLGGDTQTEWAGR